MKLIHKVLLILVVFTAFTAYLISFQLVPSLKGRYLEEMQEEYSIYLDNDIDYFDEYIDDISNDIDYISKIVLSYVDDKSNFTNYTNAEDVNFVYNPSEEEIALNNFFKEYKASNPDINVIGIGFDDGSFLIDNPIEVIGDNKDKIYNFDPRVRPWYQKAHENQGETIVSPLYQRIRLLEGTDIDDPINYYLTVAETTANQSGEIVCVSAVNIGLLDLLSHLNTVTQNKIHSLGIAFENGISCYLTDGTIIVDSEFYNSDLKTVLDQMEENGTSKCDFRDKEYCTIKRTSDSMDVTLFYIVDMNVINDNMEQYLDNIIVTMTISTGIFIFAIYLLLHFSIIAPINKLNKVTTQIRNTMDLSKKVEHISQDEVGNLANNFNYLMEEMKTYRENLDFIVDERTLELQKFSTAIEQSTAAVVITDAEGYIEYVSPKFTEMTGYEESEVIGEKTNFLNSGAHPQEFFKDLWDTILRGDHWVGVFKNKKKNGEFFYDRSRISPIMDKDGNIINFVAIKDDITEQRLMQERLTEALEDKQIILESVGEGIMGLDLNGQVTFANRKSCDLLDYSKEELEGKSIEKILYKKYDLINLEKINAKEIANQIKIGREVHAENEILLKKGNIKFIAELSAVPIIRDKKHIGAVVVFRDITEKLLIESSMENLFKNMPTGFADHELLYDDEGNAFDYRYIKINTAFKIQTGMTDDVVGKTVMELFPGTKMDWITIYDEVVKSGQPKTFEDYSIAIGKYFRVTAFATGEKTFATIFDDITESRKAQLLLLENEKRLSFLFETTPFGVITVVNGIIYYANDNFINMTGLNVRSSILSAYCNSEDWKDIEQRIESGEDIIRVETTIYDSQMQEMPVLLSVVKTDIEGEKGLLGWLMDITDIKNTENQLRIAKELAEAATEAKSDFLANMSHEIRTPMNAVIGLNRLLKSTNLTMQQEDYVEKIDRSAAQLMNIINDILDFSKIESGKMDVEKIRFNPEDVIKDQISIISLDAFNKDIELIIDKDANVPDKIKGDPHRLGQVIGNLINNAIKFTTKGHVMVSVSVVERDERDVKLKFVISDTGIGMSKEQIEKLFKPFSQADTSTTRKYGGTGLGLVIIKELVEMMDGEISVSSVEGKGSSFEFVLPFKVYKTKEKKYHPAESVKVLVVEENVLTRNVIGKYIGQFGYKYILASSANEAEECIKTDTFDVILLNNTSHEVNSAIWEKISYHYIGEKLPKVIFMQNASSKMTDIDEQQPFDVLVKPIFPSTLYNALNESLSGKKVIRRSDKMNSKQTEQMNEIGSAKVLVVEDNAINRLVVKDILKNAGIEVDEAENGRDAIQKVLNNKYDLVLMDIQMPVLDGYESTKIIRQHYSKEQLPIIALTADAVIETKNKVLEIGMNDYLSKPININKLYRRLIKWVKIKSAFVMPSVEGDDNKTLEIIKGILYDFNVDEALQRVGNNIGFYVKILNKFLQDNKNFMEEVYDSYKDNLEEFRFKIHSQKGVAAYIGGDFLYRLCVDIENELRSSGKNQQIEKHLYTMSKQLKKMLDEIEIMNSKLSEMDMFKENDLDDRTEKVDELRELVAKLESKDADIENLINSLKFRLKNNNLLGMLNLTKDFVKKAEFENAASIAKDILDMVENFKLE